MACRASLSQLGHIDPLMRRSGALAHVRTFTWHRTPRLLTITSPGILMGLYPIPLLIGRSSSFTILVLITSVTLAAQTRKPYQIFVFPPI